jgi:hypothetical protein
VAPGLEQSHEAGAAQDVGVYHQHFRSVVFRYYVLHRWPPGLAAGRKNALGADPFCIQARLF